MKTTLILSALAGLCAVLPTSLHAQSVLIDFSSAATITDNLNKGTLINSTSDGLANMGNVTYSDGTGLSGGGGGQNPAATSDIFMYGTKQAFASSFTTATTGVYVKIKKGTLEGGGLSLTSGFSNLSTPESGNGGTTGSPTSIPRPTTFTDATQNSIAVVLRGTYGETDDSWNFAAYNNGNQTNITSSGTISLTVNNWYFWETVYTNNGAGSLSLTADLYASDANGTISGTSLLTYTRTVSNSALLSADLYGFISSQNGDRRGIAQIDDLSFTAIPEPAHLGSLLGLVALAGGFITRRRRS